VLNEALLAEDVCGSGGMGAVIPNIDSRWNRMVTFTFWSPYPTREGPSVPSEQEDVPSGARVGSQASLCGVFGRLSCTGKGKVYPKKARKAPRGFL
jgi:hypothetical protein